MFQRLWVLSAPFGNVRTVLIAVQSRAYHLVLTLVQLDVSQCRSTGSPRSSLNPMSKLSPGGVFLGFECKHVRVNAKCFSHLRHSPSGDPRGCLGCEQGVTCPQGREPHHASCSCRPLPNPSSLCFGFSPWQLPWGLGSLLRKRHACAAWPQPRVVWRSRKLLSAGAAPCRLQHVSAAQTFASARRDCRALLGPQRAGL